MMMRDQGKAHFVCVFLDLPWPNKESNTNFRKRMMLPEKKEYYSEIFWKTVDWGRIFWNTELQIWKTAPFSIWNVFQMKELIKESKSADCENYGTFRLLHFIFQWVIHIKKWDQLSHLHLDLNSELPPNSRTSKEISALVQKNPRFGYQFKKQQKCNPSSWSI